MEEPKIYGIGLSHEELLVLLQAMRAPNLLDIAEYPLPNMSVEQAAAALVAGERALRARGLLQTNEEKKEVIIDPFTLALLGSCLFPERVISLNIINADGEIIVRNYYDGEVFAVEHNIIGDGTHEFSTAEQKAAIFNRLKSFLNGREYRKNGDSTYMIPYELMADIRGLLVPDRKDELEKILKKGKLSRAEVKTIGDTFRKANRVIILTNIVYGKVDDEMRGESIAFLDCEDFLWLLKDMEGVNNSLVMESVNSAEALASIDEMIEHSA